ncbi:hypothetical protein EDB86DRAFT_3036090 [Lactarius hatsudake]|nr:hypothetical protein EDB86DRAFT_3036090 [Lactarius hatsudake]
MMAQGRGGRIIDRLKHTSMYYSPSSQAHQGQASLSAYSASEFGIRALTQCAGARIGSAQPWNLDNTAITVNAYAPGPVKTPMCSALLPKYLRTRCAGCVAFLIRECMPLSKTAAVGYLGVPNDIAALVSFLASKESHLLTGQAISIDGGRHFD